MSPGHNITVPADADIRMGGLSGKISKVALPVGIILLIVSVVLGASVGEHFDRFFHGYLVALTYWLSVALGGLFFIILQPLTRSRWSPVVRRLAEIIANSIPLLFVMALAGIIVPMLAGSSGPYHHWVHPDPNDHILHGKHAWLNVPFFCARIAVYFLAWGALARYFFKKSLAQDESGDAEISERLRVASAPAMLLYAITVCFGAFDLLMSLDPHWFSTIFGVYYFAGCVLSIFASLILASLFLQRCGKLKDVITTEHYHDMGKFLFAFVFFWSYIAFSQFMLIWYANIPEETVWYQPRMFTSWSAISLVLLFGHCVFPFICLLSRWTKRWTKLLAFFAIWLLVMHYVDLFWLVMPQLTPEGFSFHPMDITSLLGMGGLFVWWNARTASKVNLIPTKDPQLGNSLHLENF
ncbi:hypothetical protein [Haliangium ochraceum]|uniref:Quinol:cytochrome C oxidoreductase n=1 Tax=Haliangium ochraceum (strain DSM 14365 / JCM 11303 / SMP-2) TaxID=502025 RepID=D0LJA6_HALO1|nr:hypothetical protein [Haliangium ochraceum]ACY14953.1 conserved hypothetical protein [Haliangium ochraceum DSM 14365]